MVSQCPCLLLICYQATKFAIKDLLCGYGLTYVLHRLPAVTNIMVTPQYLHFTQQVISSHDKANRQAEMDVSPTMGDMLTEMQGCLKQLCGNSSAGNPEAVAQLIAEKMAAMNARVQDNCDGVLALSAPVQVAATEAQVHLSSKALDFSSGLIHYGSLAGTRQKINILDCSVRLLQTMPLLLEQPLMRSTDILDGRVMFKEGFLLSTIQKHTSTSKQCWQDFIKTAGNKTTTWEEL